MEQLCSFTQSALAWPPQAITFLRDFSAREAKCLRRLEGAMAMPGLASSVILFGNMNALEQTLFAPKVLLGLGSSSRVKPTPSRQNAENTDQHPPEQILLSREGTSAIVSSDVIEAEEKVQQQPGSKEISANTTPRSQVCLSALIAFSRHHATGLPIVVDLQGRYLLGSSINDVAEGDGAIRPRDILASACGLCPEVLGESFKMDTHHHQLFRIDHSLLRCRPSERDLQRQSRPHSPRCA